MRGTVKTKTDKGFGFITPEDGSKDIYFHSSSLAGVSFDELNLGDAMEFEPTPDAGGKGPRAEGVKRA